MGSTISRGDVLWVSGNWELGAPIGSGSRERSGPSATLSRELCVLKGPEEPEMRLSDEVVEA